MRLREYRAEDAVKICNWITDEESLYEWNAALFGSYPLDPDELNANHIKAMGSGRFMAYTYIDDEDHPAGHMIIRYPDPEDDSVVRFGYVIIDPELRGKGVGRRMLEDACELSSEVFHVRKTTLSVFTRNEKAWRCYKSAGFESTGEIEEYVTPLGVWDCVLLEKKLIEEQQISNNMKEYVIQIAAKSEFDEVDDVDEDIHDPCLRFQK